MKFIDDIKGALGLSADVNKAKGKGDENLQGAVTELLPELTLDMKDDALLKVAESYKSKWDESSVKAEWLKMADENERYWKGKQFTKVGDVEGSRALQDNIVFEGTETFLPAATRQNPEPLVELRATEEKSDKSLKYAEIIRNRLADWAGEVRLRLKIKKAGRHWFISLLGAAKLGWDLTNNRPALKILRPKKLILDPDGVTDEDGYSGKYVGEYRKMEASALVKIVTDADVVKAITAEVEGEMGTDVQFIEWWTPEYMCWTMDKHVLLKKKNPHWNYDPSEMQAPAAPEENAAVDNEKNGGLQSGDNPANAPEEKAIPSPYMQAPQAPSSTPAQNHFSGKKMPYVFLTIFNLGKGPVDENNLITQSLPQQDITNKRLKQIDGNVDGMNNGMVVSEEKSGLTKDEAKQVTAALKKGGTIVIPSGSPSDAVARFPATAIPTDVYNNMVDQRNRFRDILGIGALTPSGIKNEDTVRGKIITRGLDTDRIGGGITEYFEQFSDEIFNWVVQLMYVYDDIFVAAEGAVLPKLKVSVKEGSLLPKDATTKANQAIELASAGKMSLVDLYKALEYPNPEEMAANVWIEANMPWMLFKEDQRVQEIVKMQQQSKGAAKPPSESMSFKDLPPDGKVQMAKQAGIELSPETIVAHDQAQKEGKTAVDNAKVDIGNPPPAGG